MVQKIIVELEVVRDQVLRTCRQSHVLSWEIKVPRQHTLYSGRLGTGKLVGLEVRLVVGGRTSAKRLVGQCHQTRPLLHQSPTPPLYMLPASGRRAPPARFKTTAPPPNGVRLPTPSYDTHIGRPLAHARSAKSRVAPEPVPCTHTLLRPFLRLRSKRSALWF
jgi:hypothetical protein